MEVKDWTTTPAEVGGLTPLEWGPNWGPDEDGDESHMAPTPFGNYTVELIDGRWNWRYCFDEHYDEGQSSCDSLEDGKSAAQEHWNERVSGIVSHAATALTTERAAHAETRRGRDEAVNQLDSMTYDRDVQREQCKTLLAQRDEALKALEPFGRIADAEDFAGTKDGESIFVNVNLCRAARRAREAQGGENGEK